MRCLEGSIVNDTSATRALCSGQRNRKIYGAVQGTLISICGREKGPQSARGSIRSDETGKLSELLAEKTDGSVALSRDNLASLKKQLSSFSQTFTENDFKTVYDTRYTLDSEVLEYVSVDALKNLDSVVEEMGVNFVQVRADQSGIVSYMVDSLEGVASEPGNGGDVRPVWLYEEYPAIRDSWWASGNRPISWSLPSDWSLVFQMTEEDAALYNGKTVADREI